MKTLLRILSYEKLPLYEIIVVMITFSFLWILHIGKAFERVKGSKTEITEYTMVRLNMALQCYRWANNSFPVSLDDLTCKGQDKRSSIPITTDDVVKDGWGTQYIYNNCGKYFTLKSLGADKKDGGKGDNADIFYEGP